MKKYTSYIWLFLAASFSINSAVFAGNSAKRDEAADRQNLKPELNAADQFIYYGFMKNITDDALRALQAKHGDPIRVTKKGFENRHSVDQVDYLITRHYTGAVARFFRSGNDGREFLVKYSVSTPQNFVAWGLGVGTPIQHIERALGIPDTNEDSILTYWDSENETSSVSFTYKNGRVTHIDWIFYLD